MFLDEFLNIIIIICIRFFSPNTTNESSMRELPASRLCCSSLPGPLSVRLHTSINRRLWVQAD
jgi:hypothetical protein